MSSSNVCSPSLSSTFYNDFDLILIFRTVLSCLAHENLSLRTTTQLRIILNEAPVSFAGLCGCPEDTIDGLCPAEIFVKTQQELGSVDLNWSCDGNWSVPEADKWGLESGDTSPKPGAYKLPDLVAPLVHKYNRRFISC